VQQDQTIGGPWRFAVALKETDRLIGGAGLDGSTGDESEEHALGYWLGQPIGATGMDVKPLPPSSITATGPSALKRSVPTRTQVMRLRKGFSCTAV
jgi:hypothetical protein